MQRRLFLPLPLALLAGCRSSTPYYRRFVIDPTSLIARLEEPIATKSALPAPYFERVVGRGGFGVEHHGQGRTVTGTPVQRNRFLVNRQQQLTARTKRRELLHRPYGLILSDRSTFFNPDGQREGVVFLSQLHADPTHHEPARALAGPPASLPAISALTVVRVLRGGPERLVVTAEYDGEGRPRSVSVVGSRQRRPSLTRGEMPDDYREKTKGEYLYGGSTFKDRPAVRKYFALPDSLVPFEPGAPLPSLPPAPFPDEALAVCLHYGFGDVVRVEETDAAGARTTRWLTYDLTEQDRALASKDGTTLYPAPPPPVTTVKPLAVE